MYPGPEQGEGPVTGAQKVQSTWRQPGSIRFIEWGRREGAHVVEDGIAASKTAMSACNCSETPHPHRIDTGRGPIVFSILWAHNALQQPCMCCCYTSLTPPTSKNFALVGFICRLSSFQTAQKKKYFEKYSYKMI